METTGNLFKNCLKRVYFLMNGKRPMLYQSTKKWWKNPIQLSILSNCVSLLPVCSKIFYCLIYNSMYKHISDNNLLSPSQPGFRTGDSCINQLLSITYDIFHFFDEWMETRAIFSDLKLRQFGFSGNLLALLTDFLSKRKKE